jgi:alpha-galactosidase
VDQHSTGGRQSLATDKSIVWLAQSPSGQVSYVAIFNLQDSSATLSFSWRELGLEGKQYAVRDLWERKDVEVADGLRVQLPPHGSALYSVAPNTQ